MKKLLKQVIWLLKLFSALLIASAFSFAGIYYSALEKQRVAVLKEVLAMLSLMETQLRYLRVPVSELMKSLSESSAVSDLKFIGRCSEMLENGSAFSVAWKKSVEEDNELKRLLQETYKSLALLGDEIGSTDIDGQLSICGYHRHIYTAALKEREEKYKRNSRLCPPLGLLLGVSAAIMVI